MRLEVDFVPAAGWRQAIRDKLATGARFGSLHATERGEVRALLIKPDGIGDLLTTTGRSLESIVEDVPAAGWAEREAHDQYGIEFEGHDPIRPLLNHSEEGWRVPVTGGGVHEVAVGPIHAGVIESGHFRFHTVGERIVLLDLRLFYKHRGLEKAARGVSIREAIVFAHRACGTCAVANSVAYAMAAESVLGVGRGPATAQARTVLLEMERLYNHLNDLSAICAGVGFAAGTMAFAVLKERAQRLNQKLFGHRFLFGTVMVGESQVELAANDGRKGGVEVAAIAADAASAWREMTFNGSVQDRLRGVGILTRHQAARTGAVGPSARAAGLSDDARTSSPDLQYAGFIAAAPSNPAGDVSARAEVRHLEIEATSRMLRDLLAEGLRSERSPTGAPKEQLGCGRVESPRGETLCLVEGRTDRVARLHLRTASYANWPAVVECVPGNLLPEFPLINKSFELCYACADR